MGARGPFRGSAKDAKGQGGGAFGGFTSRAGLAAVLQTSLGALGELGSLVRAGPDGACPVPVEIAEGFCPKAGVRGPVSANEKPRLLSVRPLKGRLRGGKGVDGRLVQGGGNWRGWTSCEQH